MLAWPPTHNNSVAFIGCALLEREGKGNTHTRMNSLARPLSPVYPVSGNGGRRRDRVPAPRVDPERRHRVRYGSGHGVRHDGGEDGAATPARGELRPVNLDVRLGAGAL